MTDSRSTTDFDIESDTMSDLGHYGFSRLTAFAFAGVCVFALICAYTLQHLSNFQIIALLSIAVIAVTGLVVSWIDAERDNKPQLNFLRALDLAWSAAPEKWLTGPPIAFVIYELWEWHSSAHFVDNDVTILIVAWYAIIQAAFLVGVRQRERFQSYERWERLSELKHQKLSYLFEKVSDGENDLRTSDKAVSLFAQFASEAAAYRREMISALSQFDLAIKKQVASPRRAVAYLDHLCDTTAKALLVKGQAGKFASANIKLIYIPIERDGPHHRADERFRILNYRIPLGEANGSVAFELARSFNSPPSLTDPTGRIRRVNLGLYSPMLFEGRNSIYIPNLADQNISLDYLISSAPDDYFRSPKAIYILAIDVPATYWRSFAPDWSEISANREVLVRGFLEITSEYENFVDSDWKQSLIDTIGTEVASALQIYSALEDQLARRG